MSPLLLGIAGYILLQLVIGVLVSRRIRSEADYLLAGRRLGLTLGAFTVFATWFGAETVVGAAGEIYADGLTAGAAEPFAYGATLLLMGAVFAAPLWRRGLTTFADLFRTRYSPGVERLVVLLIIPPSVMWAAAQIRAFGQVISASSAFEVEAAITCAAAVVLIYTIYGGLLADAITDVIQGIALVIGLVVVFAVVIGTLGGPGAALAAIPLERVQPLAVPRDLALLGLLERWAIPLCGSVLAQELIARVLAMRSPELARRAVFIGGGLYIAVGFIPVFLGLVGAQLLAEPPAPEQLMAQLAQQYLPTFLYIAFAGALVSAILSTVDSALLAAGALASHNLIVPLRPALSERAKVRAARGGVLVFGLIAYVLALHAEGVYDLVLEASAFGSAGVFTVGVFALFTRFGDAQSATAALLAGLVSWIAGAYVLDLPYPYLTSLAASVLVYVAGGLLELGAARVYQSG